MSMRRTPAVPEPVVPAPFSEKRASERRQGNYPRSLLVTVLVIAILYLAKPVVVPVALAVLFAFLLTPIVALLERTFLRRTGAGVLALGLVVAGLGGGERWVSH